MFTSIWFTARALPSNLVYLLLFVDSPPLYSLSPSDVSLSPTSIAFHRVSGWSATLLANPGSAAPFVVRALLVSWWYASAFFFCSPFVFLYLVMPPRLAPNCRLSPNICRPACSPLLLFPSSRRFTPSPCFPLSILSRVFPPLFNIKIVFTTYRPFHAINRVLVRSPCLLPLLMLLIPSRFQLFLLRSPPISPPSALFGMVLSPPVVCILSRFVSITSDSSRPVSSFTLFIFLRSLACTFKCSVYKCIFRFACIPFARVSSTSCLNPFLPFPGMVLLSDGPSVGNSFSTLWISFLVLFNFPHLSFFVGELALCPACNFHVLPCLFAVALATVLLAFRPYYNKNLCLAVLAMSPMTLCLITLVWPVRYRACTLAICLNTSCLLPISFH